MAVATPDSYTFTPGTTLYAGLPTPSVGGLITTLSLVNTSGSTQAANFVSPMFGQPFVEGDLPAGEYPAFTLEDDTPVAATVYSDVAWGDDSKKFCGVILRSPASIAGSATQTINVNSGGTAPAASSRSLSDLTAADLKIELTGITALSGVWVASLNTAITDATDIVVIGDGPAGKVWRIGGPFKQSGSAHGQLYCWHYVAALQDASGNLMGLRYLGRIAQPFTDITSPAVAKRDFTAVLKSGVTTIRTLQGIQSGEIESGTISLTHYASFYTCDTDGLWDFVQGGGSASTDCTVRVVHDMDYVVKSRLVPPYDRAQSMTEPTSIDYIPGCRGSMLRATGTTGERQDIAVFPSWYVRHIISPTAVSERIVRVNGLATAGWRVGLRQSSTLNPPAVVDIEASYPGLGATQPTWRYWTAGIASGVNAIPAAHLWSEEYDGHHRPQGGYYPYLLTGEPQYLDILVEQASSFIAIPPAGGGTTWKIAQPIMDDAKTGSFHARDNTIDGVTYKGSGLMMRQDLARYQAWMLRDVGQAFGIYPDVCPYETGIRDYLEDVLDSNFAAYAAYRAAMPQSYRDDGLYCLRNTSLGGTDHPWCIGYMCDSFAHLFSLTRKTEIFNTAQHFGNYWAGIASRWDIATAMSIESYVFLPSGERLNSLDGMAFNARTVSLTYDAATNRMGKSGADSTFSTTNGDLFLSRNAYISTLPENTRLYAVNSDGSTWQPATEPGGSPVTITGTGTSPAGAGMAVQDFDPRFSFEGYTGSSVYQVSIRGAIKHLMAIGVTGLTQANTEADEKFTSAGISLVGDPKSAKLSAYPE